MGLSNVGREGWEANVLISKEKKSIRDQTKVAVFTDRLRNTPKGLKRDICMDVLACPDRVFIKEGRGGNSRDFTNFTGIRRAKGLKRKWDWMQETYCLTLLTIIVSICNFRKICRLWTTTVVMYLQT